MTISPKTHRVEPDRLAPGIWSEEFNRFIDECDIARSYCADTISMHGTTRQPFIFRGDLWVSVNLSGGVAQSYRLIPIDDFNTNEIIDLNDNEARRAQELGFYHGVVVSYGQDWFVIAGPPVYFEPGRIVQPGLFAD